MQSLSSLAFLVFVVGFALGDEKMCHPAPGQKFADPHECCMIADLVPEFLKTSAVKCIEKYMMNMSKPTRPAPTGPPPTPSAEMVSAHVCVGECIFSELDLLTADKKLDKAAIAKFFTTFGTTLAPVMTSAADTCYGSYEADVNKNLTCKSGGNEFQVCVMKEVFYNCPSSLWSASSECDEWKSKFPACKMIPFMMAGPLKKH